MCVCVCRGGGVGGLDFKPSKPCIIVYTTLSLTKTSAAEVYFAVAKIAATY